MLSILPDLETGASPPTRNQSPPEFFGPILGHVLKVWSVLMLLGYFNGKGKAEKRMGS